MKVTIGRISFLLAGDIEAEIERQLTAGGQDLSAASFKNPKRGP
ncbi:MAG: hypothetical protein ACE5G8_00850 [Anaerolineae bacterium]